MADMDARMRRDDRIRLWVRVVGVVAIATGIVLASMNLEGVGAAIGCAGTAGIVIVAWTVRRHALEPGTGGGPVCSLEAGWLAAFVVALMLFAVHSLGIWHLDAQLALALVAMALAAPLLVPGSARRPAPHRSSATG